MNAEKWNESHLHRVERSLTTGFELLLALAVGIRLLSMKGWQVCKGGVLLKQPLPPLPSSSLAAVTWGERKELPKSDCKSIQKGGRRPTPAYRMPAYL